MQAKSNEAVIELWHGHKRYLVKKSDVNNGSDKIIVLPDGTAFDLNRMYVKTTDKHGYALSCSAFAAHTVDYEAWGRLPVVGFIVAVEADGERND